MTNLAAIRSAPTGFRDVAAHETPVTIVGFVYGKHQDAGGYGRVGECTLAVYQHEDGWLDAGPLSWFRAFRPLPAKEEGRNE